MFELGTLKELVDAGSTGEEIVSELMVLVVPRDFRNNTPLDPEKHRIVGRASEKTARLCAVTKQIGKIRRAKPPISDEDDLLVTRISSEVAKARETSLRRDCKGASPRVSFTDPLFVCCDGVIVTKKKEITTKET